MKLNGDFARLVSEPKNQNFTPTNQPAHRDRQTDTYAQP